MFQGLNGMYFSPPKHTTNVSSLIQWHQIERQQKKCLPSAEGRTKWLEGPSSSRILNTNTIKSLKWDGRWDGGSKGRGHMYTYGWFMLMYGRNRYNIIKQYLSIKKKIFLCLKNSPSQIKMEMNKVQIQYNDPLGQLHGILPPTTGRKACNIIMSFISPQK